MTGACECGRASWGSVKCGEFPEDLLVSHEGPCSMERAVVRLYVNVKILEDGKYSSL